MHTLLSKRNRAECAARPACGTHVHGPFGYTGIWDLDEAERLKALDEHRRHLEASAEIGAHLYVVHPDWRPDVRPRDPAVIAAAGPLVRDAASRGRTNWAWTIVVENMPGAGHVALHAIPATSTCTDSGLILDVGHASISGCLDAWLADPRVPLRHLHVHDNHGEGDDDDPHLGLAPASSTPRP